MLKYRLWAAKDQVLCRFDCIDMLLSMDVCLTPFNYCYYYYSFVFSIFDSMPIN